MKSTIKISAADSIVVEPVAQTVKISLKSFLTIERTLSVDQASAIVFALEQALDAVATCRHRSAGRQGLPLGLEDSDVPY